MKERCRACAETYRIVFSFNPVQEPKVLCLWHAAAIDQARHDGAEVTRRKQGLEAVGTRLSLHFWKGTGIRAICLGLAIFFLVRTNAAKMVLGHAQGD